VGNRAIRHRHGMVHRFPGVAGALGDPFLDPVGQSFEMIDAPQHHQFLLEVVPWLERLAIPAGNFSEGEAGKPLVPDGREKVEMPPHESQPFNGIGARAGVASAVPRVKLPEKPRVQERSPTYGQPRATGFRKHAGGIGECLHITVSKNGNATGRLHHLPDSGKVDTPGKTLFARPAMDGDGLDPDKLESAREVRRGMAGGIPTQSHLHRHGHGDRFDHGSNQVDRLPHMAKEGRTTASLGDLGGQPMLMSMLLAPSDSTLRAAAASSPGSAP